MAPVLLTRISNVMSVGAHVSLAQTHSSHDRTTEHKSICVVRTRRSRTHSRDMSGIETLQSFGTHHEMFSHYMTRGIFSYILRIRQDQPTSCSYILTACSGSFRRSMCTLLLVADSAPPRSLDEAYSRTSPHACCSEGRRVSGSIMRNAYISRLTKASLDLIVLSQVSASRNCPAQEGCRRCAGQTRY